MGSSFAPIPVTVSPNRACGNATQRCQNTFSCWLTCLGMIMLVQGWQHPRSRRVVPCAVLFYVAQNIVLIVSCLYGLQAVC